MTENHSEHVGSKVGGSIKKDDTKRFSANLNVAIRLIDVSWTMLSESAGYSDLEKPEPEDDTPQEYFHAMKHDALELADGIYWSASDAGRRKDDRDLARLESTGALADDASPRIQALALLTLAKELVELPWRRLIDAPRVFQD